MLGAPVYVAMQRPLVTAGFEQVRGHAAVARAAGGPFDRAVEDAVADGVITASEGLEYLSRLQAASDRDAFFFAAASVVASGLRPR